MPSEYHWYLNTDGMDSRCTRADATARNRTLLLEAARRVFLERGFNGATLEAIASAAGFSKGVVYSQFDSKADLFLALLEERQQERAGLHREAAAGLAGPEGVLDLLALWDRDKDRDAPWMLLVMEFRVQAARDAGVNARYAALHERTLDGVAATLETIFANALLPLPLPARLLAQAVLALSVGVALERAADARALPVADARLVIGRLFSGASASSGASPRRSPR